MSDPTNLGRRALLKALAAAPYLAQPVAWAHPRDAAASPALQSRRLLVVELSGGNDGLNTVIPYADPLYAQLRPGLAVPREQVITLSETTGLHPALAALQPVFQAGDLAIVQGLGYVGPNRSHFRSVEIWDTADEQSEAPQLTGWLAPAEARLRQRGSYSAHGAVIGRNPLPLSGEGLNTVVLKDSQRFRSSAAAVGRGLGPAPNPELARLMEVQRGIREAGAGLQEAPLPRGFPDTRFGRSLAEAARLLRQDHFAPVVKVALQGFDTHFNQRGTHERLLRQLAEGLAALRQDLIEAGRWQQTLVMTYSEFGRRARENGSRGTDHGTAAPHFVLGGAVRGGFHGEAPSLGTLDEGDLRFSVDFRSYYNTVLARWWGWRDLAIAPDRYPPLRFV